MSKPKLTPWFPVEIKPVRKGWYECSICIACKNRGFNPPNTKHYWNGRYWTNRVEGEFPFFSKFSWRGLAQKP